MNKNTVNLVVTDSITNMKAVLKQTFGKDKHLLCFAHTLNLVKTYT